VLKDELVVDIISEDIDKSAISTNVGQINQQGQKSIKFSIKDPVWNEEKIIKVSVLINIEKITEIKLQVKGQILEERRRNVGKEIENGTTKAYSCEIAVSRVNFMNDLFEIAKQGLFRILRVQFKGEDGVDAGGLKREFYDLIGR
jgi:hypothetical protein